MELQFITHFTDTYSYYDSARMALEGGCRWIQLRMKDTPVSEVEREALRLQPLCKDYGATFIIDDHVELVKKIHADGVHLGKKDMPIAEARNILGKEFIIGGTANTFDDVKMHYAAGADYIGCGPFRFTTTKKKLTLFEETAEQAGNPAVRCCPGHLPQTHPPLHSQTGWQGRTQPPRRPETLLLHPPLLFP